jgi:hypothetical protein
MTAPVGISLPALNFIGEGDFPSSLSDARCNVLLLKSTCFLTGAVAGTTGRALCRFKAGGGDM